jgi:hypothetical protein
MRSQQPCEQRGAAAVQAGKENEVVLLHGGQS